MKLEVQYPDAEVQARQVMSELLADEITASECTVGVGKPTGWTVDSPPHVQVAGDGTPVVRHPIAVGATIRITVWARNTGTAKDLAARALGLFWAQPMVRPLTGLLADRDPQTGAELASFTSRLTVRSQPL